MISQTYRKATLAFLLLFGTLWILFPPVVAGGEGEPQVQTINSMCPLLPDEPVDPRYVVSYQGQSIGLCCVKCKRKFEKDPEAWANKVEEFNPSEAIAAIALPIEGFDLAPETEPAVEDSQGLQLGFIEAVGRFHPLAVHLPLGLFFAAALAELLYLLKQDKALRVTVKFCWYLGLAGACGAALLGLATATEIRPSDPILSDVFNHRNAGIATLILAISASVALKNALKDDATSKHQLIWRIGLLATLAVVGLTGHLGGILVFGPDHLPI